jgi:hypothetical protein
MERLKNITIIFLLAVGLLNSVVLAKSASTLLQEGLYAEQIDGDLDAAIRIYEQIIADTSAQRSHIAQAMYRQGMCYLKKKDEQQAKEVFRKLVTNYSDQTKIVDKVKPMLDELGNADPAALMPPETLIYIETGSPGRQIETILNMLKGTPFENPLAALGGGRGIGPGGRSHGDMMAALMNPAMMAEFKKIRGMGVGITGLAQNNPPAIAVLFPGKSDALRGLILAALGMVGKPGEPIEGMQTVTIAGTAGVAYDDNIVIIAKPAGQLTWSVRQYKGVSTKPTLASSNKSFAKLSKKARQENALTIWANVDEVFAGLSEILPADMIPSQIRLADGFADFKNIDDLIAFFNIQENGIAFETNIAFKDGHHCLAYNMIRTPNLSRAGFEAVPSEAVALVSLALGEAESAQTKAISKSIESLMGLDIGREIFANIEQITLFALPPESTSAKGNTVIPPIVTNLGLAITSHNPQQTREILNQLFTVSNLIASQFGGDKPEQVTGKYQIGLINNQKIYCYMDQMNKTTVLSLNPDVVETSISAIKRRRSVCTAGPLREAVNKLSPTTSKLVLVNVGGGIRIADDYLKATYDNPQNPAHKMFAQLAQACDKTGIQFHTDEKINNLNACLSIDQLPPLDNVFPLLMQISQTDPTAKARATKPEPPDGATIGLSSVSKLEWKPGANAKSHKIYFGTKVDELPLLAEVQSPNYGELPELEEDAKYYWRVDEVWADGTVITGDVWSFTVGKLVGWWKFDETEGGNAIDSSPSGNVGKLSGNPQWQPTGGKIGGALKFDGVDDYVETDNATDLSAWTVAVWVNSPAAPSSAGPSGPVHREKNYQVNWNHSMGHFRGSAGISVGGEWHPASFGNLQANKWYHLVATYDGENLKAYKDGVLITNNSAPSGTPDAESATLTFGKHSAASDYFGGTIDDVRIYSYALSPDEIEALNNVTATKPRPMNRAVLDPTAKVELSWEPGIGAAGHKVYLGTKPDELSLLGEVTSPAYTELPSLEKDTEYYWRVDKIQSNGVVDSGEIWSFTTGGKLVGWWKFDGDANDSSGNGNNGTEIGDPTYVTGRIGQAISFDGEGDRIEVPATVAGNPELFPAKAISASAWVRATVSANPTYSLVRHEFHFTPLQTYTGSAHAAAFTNQDGTRTLHMTRFNWNKINDGKWHHCAVTYNNGIHEVWIDGTKEVSDNFGSYPLWTGDDQPWVFGGRERGEGGGEHYPGELDDVRIYNYALSESEIKTLYNEGK